MTTTYSSLSCKTAISPSRLPGLDYTLNPYSGCEHGCLYCYVRGFYGNRESALKWGSHVGARVNIAEVLLKQIRKIGKGVVGVSTITDPYQPLENEFRLTRRCLEILVANCFPVSIQTKSSLVLNDLDIICKNKESFDIGFTITTLDSDMARKMQPKAPKPEALIQALENLSEKHIDTWIFLGPLLPEITDSEENIRSVVEVARKTRSILLYDRLNLKPWWRDSLSDFLESEREGLTDRLPFLLSHNSEYWQNLMAKVERICRDICVDCRRAFR